MNLAEMTPHNDLASTGYCLAHPGKEYLVYLPTGGEVAVDLSGAPGKFAVEWIDPVDGSIMSRPSTDGGAKRTLRAPFGGQAALCLKIREPVKAER
jgi:hypothetical protein